MALATFLVALFAFPFVTAGPERSERVVVVATTKLALRSLNPAMIDRGPLHLNLFKRVLIKPLDEAANSESSHPANIYQQTTGETDYQVQLSKSFLQPPPIHGRHWLKARDLEKQSMAPHRLTARAMGSPYGQGPPGRYGPTMLGEPEVRGCLSKRAWDWLKCKNSCCWLNCCERRPNAAGRGGRSQYKYSQYGDSVAGPMLFGPNQLGGGMMQRGGNQPMGTPQVQTMRGHVYPLGEGAQGPLIPMQQQQVRPQTQAGPIQSTNGNIYTVSAGGHIYQETVGGSIYKVGEQRQPLAPEIVGPAQTGPGGGVYGRTANGLLLKQTLRGGLYPVADQLQQRPIRGAGPVAQAPQFQGAQMHMPRPASTVPRIPSRKEKQSGRHPSSAAHMQSKLQQHRRSRTVGRRDNMVVVDNE